MIQKINKPLSKIKFGLIGFRSHLVEDLLSSKSLTYQYITEDTPIDSTFDLVFGSGVYNILSKEIITTPTYGCYFIHESPLPEGRGHAPIQWTIENNRPNFTLSLFKVLPGVDDGGIVYQHNVGIDNFDSVNTIEKKRQQGIIECFNVFLEELKEGIIVIRKQTGKSSYYKKRSPQDSKLTSITNLSQFWQELRMCDNEKYPAFFELEGKKIFLKYYLDDYK